MVPDVHTQIGEQVDGVLRRQTQLLGNLVHPDLRHLCLSPADHSKPWSAPAESFSSFIVALSMWYAFPKRPTCQGMRGLAAVPLWTPLRYSNAQAASRPASSWLSGVRRVLARPPRRSPRSTQAGSGQHHP